MVHEKLAKFKGKVILLYDGDDFMGYQEHLLKFKDYKIKSAAMFYLSPQTPHVEAVVELIRTH